MKSPVMILHGWQTPSKKYHVLQQLLTKSGYDVYCPDLPGFGKESLKNPHMNLSDYVEFVKKYLEKKKLRNVVIIGHSFGGRVGTKFAVQYPDLIKKLIITGSPLIKRKLSLKKRCVAVIAKIMKPIFQLLPKDFYTFFQKLLYFSIKEWDYYNAGRLRETFQSVIAEDLSPLLRKIQCPVLIIWGEHDTVVSLSDGKQIAGSINNSQFVSLPHATHKLPYEDPKRFFETIEPFLK